jgi:hypothetical protein
MPFGMDCQSDRATKPSAYVTRLTDAMATLMPLAVNPA